MNKEMKTNKHHCKTVWKKLTPETTLKCLYNALVFQENLFMTVNAWKKFDAVLHVKNI